MCRPRRVAAAYAIGAADPQVWDSRERESSPSTYDPLRSERTPKTATDTSNAHAHACLAFGLGCDGRDLAQTSRFCGQIGKWCPCPAAFFPGRAASASASASTS